MFSLGSDQPAYSFTEPEGENKPIPTSALTAQNRRKKMKLAALGIIATTLLAGTIIPVTNAGSRSPGNFERKLERVENREHRQQRNEEARRERRADRNQRRRGYGDRLERSNVRYGRGHGTRARWRRNNRYRYAVGRGYYRRHPYRNRHYRGPSYGHSRIVLRQQTHGNPMPAIAGGIIGGVIANEASGGNQGATVVGAVVGAVIASDITRRRHYRQNTLGVTRARISSGKTAPVHYRPVPTSYRLISPSYCAM